jgi:hypothetical protein
MLRKYKAVFAVVAVVLALSITTLSASPAVSQPLSTAAQSQVQGGVSCDYALGLTAGLAIGALTPCSIICAVGAWYSLALVAVDC